jgi:hypothetical protein
MEGRPSGGSSWACVATAAGSGPTYLAAPPAPPVRLSPAINRSPPRSLSLGSFDPSTCSLVHTNPHTPSPSLISFFVAPSTYFKGHQIVHGRHHARARRKAGQQASPARRQNISGICFKTSHEPPLLLFCVSSPIRRKAAPSPSRIESVSRSGHMPSGPGHTIHIHPPSSLVWV